jgi:hypothetical protein
MSRNGYMMKGALARRGYDWWWHSLVGADRETGELRPFFIEYYIINPALGGKTPVLGQLGENLRKGIRPSYAMIKCGTWGKASAVQIHNFYGVSEFEAARDRMDVLIGANTANETRLTGAAEVSEKDAAAHPEWMSDAGAMRWDLKVKKILSYDIDLGSSRLMRELNAFDMYWHVQGMLTQYAGTIFWNGREFAVRPETCCGYQDKNWGTDYTNPWVWLNCNNFRSERTGERLARTSLDVGGVLPRLFGVALPRRVVIAFYLEGELYEFNFSKAWTLPRQKLYCAVGKERVVWQITASTNKAKIEIDFSCPLDHMLRFNYENPDGAKNHNELWNGHHASGTVKLYRRTAAGFKLIDTFLGEMGGCEYGKY